MKKVLAAYVVVAFLGLHDGPLSAQSGHELFQKALAAERADGNLREAIQLYERVVKQFASDRALAARALVRIAECYEKLGQRDAAKVYERVLREFSDQRESSSVARARLTALQAPPLPATQTVRQLWSGSGVDALGAPSPDGRYLTFTDWETGDLAVRDLVHGTNRRLTNTGGWEASGDFAEYSVWSPDGRQIAYAWFVERAVPPDGNCVCRYELRVMSSGSDASAPRIVHRSVDTVWIQPVAWTPNGRQVLAVRQQAGRTLTLELFGVTDGTRRVVKNLGTQDTEGVALSPDGRFVAYGWSADGENAQRDISLIDLQDGREERLVSHPSYDRSPMWSADGAHLLFVSDRTGSDSIWRLPFSAGRAAGAPVMMMSAPYGFDHLMGLARNGALYYATGAQNTNIYVTALEANGSARTPEGVAIQRFLNSNQGPTWSPDGNSLAYVSRRGHGESPQSSRLVIHSFSTGEDREVPLKVRLRYRVFWFPDGSSVLVMARDAQRRVAYYRVALATGSMELLTTAVGSAPGAFRPELSADGRTLFYAESTNQAGPESNAQQFVRFDLTSGTKTVVFSDVKNMTSFAVSPDGTMVAYFDDNLGAPNTPTVLAVRSTGGGAPRELARHTNLKSARFSGLAWSRDQRYVFYVKPTKQTTPPPTELWKAPLDGGAPAPTGISMPGMIRAPSVHPDGRRIAFSAIGGGTLPAIWVAEGISPPRRAPATK